MAEFWDIVDENGNITGRLHEKGKPMQQGEYHLAVSVWIINTSGEFLISQRSSTDEHSPSIWETTSGSALAGEDSLSAALREANEELGILLKPKNGRNWKSYLYPHSNGNGAAYFDVWIFRQDIDSSKIVLQKGEISKAKWANQVLIKQMIAGGKFTPYSYIDELFQSVR